jgi:hypothetical protein
VNFSERIYGVRAKVMWRRGFKSTPAVAAIHLKYLNRAPMSGSCCLQGHSVYGKGSLPVSRVKFLLEKNTVSFQN